MKKRKLMVAAIIGQLIICFIAAAVFLQGRYLSNTIDVAKLPGLDAIELEPAEYIELPSNTKEGFGFSATGISYSELNDCFYIGNYGKASKDDKEFHPSIERIDSKFAEIQEELYFEESKMDIQGIAYDDANDSIWYTNGRSVINCGKDDGEAISSFGIGKYSKYKANGVCIDARDGSLWVLCMYKYLLHFKKDGSLIDAYGCDYIGQDHICMDEDGNLYISVGVDYQGNDNFVLAFDKNINLKQIYRVNGSYAIEGIAVVGSHLYVVNDGIYHEAKIKRNYIQKYAIAGKGEER